MAILRLGTEAQEIGCYLEEVLWNVKMPAGDGVFGKNAFPDRSETMKRTHEAQTFVREWRRAQKDRGKDIHF